MKIADLIHFQGETQENLMGEIRTSHSLLSKFVLFKDRISLFKEVQFWDTFYQLNNEFYENNHTLFDHLQQDGNQQGANKLLNKKVNGIPVLKNDLIDQISDREGFLNLWGIKATSLGDIIRSMASLRIELNSINQVCSDISSKYKIDKKLAYAVLTETEEEFSLNGYLKNKTKLVTHGLIESLSPVFCYLYPTEGIELLLLSKEYYSTLKYKFIRNTLSIYEIDPVIRPQIWWGLVDIETEGLQMISEFPEVGDIQIIKIDLHRSQNLFEKNDFEILYRILGNIALAFPDVSYYQGMNYIAIFLLHVFKDELKTFKFLSFIVKEYLSTKYTSGFEGLLELMYLCDKFLQGKQPEIWHKMLISRISCLYFAVPCFITLMTHLQKFSLESRIFIEKFWDLFLSGGFKTQVEVFLYLLQVQKVNMIQVDDDKLLLAIKNMDSNPLPTMEYTGVSHNEILSFITKIRKRDLKHFVFDRRLYERYLAHYKTIHKPIAKHWE